MKIVRILLQFQEVKIKMFKKIYQNSKEELKITIFVFIGYVLLVLLFKNPMIFTFSLVIIVSILFYLVLNFLKEVEPNFKSFLILLLASFLFFVCSGFLTELILSIYFNSGFKDFYFILFLIFLLLVFLFINFSYIIIFIYKKIK